LSELRAAPPPPRSELLTALSARLPGVIPGFRALATDLLADSSRIDVFGVTDDGVAVLALIGDAGDDLVLLARALAQREWLAPRLADWLKLAPDLGLRSGEPVRAVVLCPSFGPEVRAALRSLEPGAVELVAWRFLRNGSDADLLLDPLCPAPASPGPAVRPGELESPSSFRTGLSERDLGLSDAERAEFE